MPEDVKDESSPSGKVNAPEVPRADGAQSEEKLPFSEHPRWKEVYGSLKEYKALGKPEDIETKLNRAAELESIYQEAQRLAAQETAQASKTTDERAAEDIQRKARAELFKLLPELQELEALKSAQQARNVRLERAATAETRDILKEIDEELTDQSVGSMSEILADIIKHDETLLAEYETAPRKVVRAAFDKFSKRFGGKSDRASTASKQKDRESAAKLPKAHGAGGGEESAGGGKAPGEIRTIKEASERAAARLKGMEL
jgi:hypothetical protein